MNFTGKKAAANPPEKETYFRHPKKRHQEEVEKNIKKEEKRVDGKPSPCYTRTIEKRTKSPRCTLKTEQRFAPEFPAKGHLNRNGRSWYKKSGSMLEQYK